MKRLEQIKRRFELNLSSPKEYGHLMSNPEANIEYLIGLVEQAEKDLKLIANGNNEFPTWGDTVDVLRDVRLVAKEALKSIQGDE